MAEDTLRKEHEELLQEGRRQTKLDKERADVFEALVKSPGWKIYEELLGARIQALGGEILEPAGSVDGAIALEHVKGTMKGLILARDLPSIIIGNTKADTSAQGETE